MAWNTTPIFTKVWDVSSDASTTMVWTITTATGDYTGASAL